ncbi:MAG: hypothetical protein WC637_01925 [Victivallales bacterium]
MKIELNWSTPFILLDGSSSNMVYALPENNRISNTSGIYIFYRKYGEAISAVYIGKADNISQRVNQQFNNVRLMMAIKNSGAGSKHLIYGQLKAKQGQNVKRVIKLLERQFIAFAKLNGHNLVNIHGTKSSFHEVKNSGNLDIRKILSFKMNIKAK